MPSWLPLAKRRYRLLRRLSWSDRRLLLEAWIALGIARLCIVVLPFRWMVPWLDQVCNDEPGQGDAQRVGLALFYVARVTPWRSKCFEQALAGKLMLHYRRLPTTLHLGVAKQATTLEAHAWLVCQGQIITGGPNVDNYGVVACFGASVNESVHH